MKREKNKRNWKKETRIRIYWNVAKENGKTVGNPPFYTVICSILYCGWDSRAINKKT